MEKLDSMNVPEYLPARNSVPRASRPAVDWKEGILEMILKTVLSRS